MNTAFLIVGLSAFLVFLPFYFAVLFLVVEKQYKNYSVLTFWLSNLGAKKSRGRSAFNVCLFVFGLFGLLLGRTLFEILPQTSLASAMSAFFSAAALLAVFIPFFPTDRKRKIHTAIANLLFVCILVASLLFTFLVFVSKLFPVFLAVFSLAVFVFSFLTVYSYLKLKAKYGGRALGDLVCERKKEKSFVLKNATLWEWLVFSSLVVWLFVLVICILGFLLNAR
ncbi:MAG: hypothetical protein M1127_00090 [Patescibacteria group bacterium]|nr:hypothetical protein [Patescibacteria group bacterium]